MATVTKIHPDGSTSTFEIPDAPYARPQQARPDGLQDAFQAFLDDMVTEGILPAAKATLIINRYKERR